MEPYTYKCSNADYHADVARVSQSMLKVLSDNPARYHGRYIAKTIPPEQSDALDLGSVVHGMLLGDGSKWHVIPPEVLTSNGQRRGKAWEAFAAEHADMVLISDSDCGRAIEMCAGVQRRELAKLMLLGAKRCEETIHWTDGDTGIDCKAKPDLWLPGNWIADLKTARSAEPSAFAKAAYAYGYDRQAAWYQDAVEALTGLRLPFVFIVVEKEPPHTCRLLELSADFVDRGRIKNRAALEQLAKCRETDVWDVPGADDIIEIQEPRYARYDQEYAYQED